MAIITITNLIHSGVHGSTGREPFDPQRFRCNIEIHVTAEPAFLSDNINDTYDYKFAIEAARSVISDEHHTLIERIAYRIAEIILAHSRVEEVSIWIEKLNASQNCIPGFRMNRKRTPQEVIQ